jgi:nucleotide-binding universal stress UspA family protein
LEPIGRQILARAEAAAKKAGVVKVERVLMSGDAADAILAEAKRAKPDLIVLGTRGFGDFKSLVLGSVSHKVALHASCAVTTVK